MARRFQRENFLFPVDLRRPRAEVSARPTDPFVSASEGTVEQATPRPYDIQRPSRNNSLLSLAESLGVASRVAKTFSDSQYADYVDRETAQGAYVASQEAIAGNKRAFKKVIQDTRLSSGDAAAREVMSMSPHFQRGFNQTRARGASLDFNAFLQSEYASNPLLEGDEVSGVRLHDVDVADPRYQQWLSDFTNSFIETQSVDLLDPLSQATFSPAVQDSHNRVSLAHDTLRSQRRLAAYEDETTSFVSSLLLELGSNSGFISGSDSNLLVEAANNITNQLDEANALGYGGEDLQNIYSQVIESVIATAVTSSNADLLDVLSIVEVGNPQDRRLILDQSGSTKYKSAIIEARQSILDKEFRDNQRTRQVREQRREDSRRDGLENLALAGAFYERQGKTPEAYESLQRIINDIRVDAAANGWLSDLDAAQPTILQNAVDNQRVSVVDYSSMNAIEADISNGNLSGQAAQRRLNDLFVAGSLGTGSQMYSNYQRINDKIKSRDDSNLSDFSREVDQAAAEIESVITNRYGFTEDERGQLQTIRETLESNGFNIQEINAFTQMSESQLDSFIAENAEQAALGQALPLSSTAIQAMNMIVSGGLDPLAVPEPIDPGQVQLEIIDFKNNLYDANREFLESEGRHMTPQERGEFIRNSTSSYITRQRGQLPVSNPLSSLSNPNTDRSNLEDSFYDSVLGNVSEFTGDPRTETILDGLQASKAFEHFIITDRWHPEIISLAEANNMTPRELVQSQATLNGVEISDDARAMLGLGVDPTPQSGSVMSTREISRDYVEGQYTTFRQHFIDDWSGNTYSPGAYDFTFIQNGNDIVNVPSPVNGVVTEAQHGCTVGDTNCGGGYGNYVVVSDPTTGYQWFLAHLGNPYLQVGDSVSRGQAIGQQNTTGSSTGPHIHLEMLDRNGVKISNRDVTRPLVEQYINDVESGYFLPSSNQSSSPTITIQPNDTQPLYGHAGYDEAQDLAVAEVAFDGYEHRLQPVAATAWQSMKQAAQSQGIDLTLVSGYRSRELQESLWNDQVSRRGSESEAAKYSAPPGHSQHHTGLAVDINSLSESFGNTQEYKWLVNNAQVYGFEESFKNDPNINEPWQWVYTGKTQSTSNPTRESDFYSALETSASRLGVDPLELGAVLAKESSLDINAVGGAGGNYQGLWQASPDVRSRYGVYAGMPADQQLQALEQYLSDRGYTPDRGIEGLYATILVGNPDNRDSQGNYNPADSFGTRVTDVLSRFRPGGDKYEEAREFFGL